MKGQFVHTYLQREGGIQDCGNYRGIKKISHVKKIRVRIIDRRPVEERGS